MTPIGETIAKVAIALRIPAVIRIAAICFAKLPFWRRPQPIAKATILVGLLLLCVSSAYGAAIAAKISNDLNGRSLLLLDDGTVWEWGTRNDVTGLLHNTAKPVQVLSGAQAIAAGGIHSLALKADGTVWAWGYNQYGQLGDGSNTSLRVVPEKVLSGVQMIASGLDHSLAIKLDGTLWAWGGNGYGQVGDGSTVNRIAPVQVMSDVRAIAAGFYFSFAIKTDGTLWAWGSNQYGNLGDSTKINRATPVQVLSNVQSISAGISHALAIKADSTLWAWGDDSYKQLGTSAGATLIPIQVMAGVQSVAAGGFHSLAIKLGGTLWAWGYNQFGQVGDGSSDQYRAIPVQILSDVRAIAAGGVHSLALKSDGSLLAWGDNTTGELGDDGVFNSATSVQVLTDVQAVATSFHSLAIKTDGTLWAWGFNGFGQLGNGTAVDSPTPTQVFSNVRAVAAGTNAWHSLAIRTDETLWAWGYNAYGQLGDGSTVNRALPVQVLTGIQAVSASDFYSLAVKTDGTLLAWGGNQAGQLGDGTTLTHPSPEKVLSDVRAVATGEYHSLALKTDGSVWAWGDNSGGQLGDGTNTGRSLPVQVFNEVQAVAAGGYHSLALRTDGTLWAWGFNRDGQLGDGGTVNRVIPTQVLSNVKAVAAGSYFTVAIKTDGTVWVWGTNESRILGPGGGTIQLQPRMYPYLLGATQVAAGEQSHALVLTDDGRLMGWGDNGYEFELGISRLKLSRVPLLVRDPLAPYAGSDLVIEYFNPTIVNGAGQSGIGHYFITAVAAEALSIDTGGAGLGWARTGRSFRAWNDPSKAPAGAVGVCRFYAQEPNSHFYTADTNECQNLKSQNPSNNPLLGWSYEGIAFYTVVPTGGSCPAGYFPIYRSYNNRFGSPAVNDSNHRLTPSYNDYQRSIRFFGYVDEGIAFCSPMSPNPGGDLQVTYSYPGASVMSGAPVSVEFLFSNNGAGQSDGSSIYAALPKEVTNWSITCAARLGATCPSNVSLASDLLRRGLEVSKWPAGGGLTVTATGTAPQANIGGDNTLNFAATVTSVSGSADGNPANDTPPQATTVVQSQSGCNFDINPRFLFLGPTVQSPHFVLNAGDGCAWSAQSNASWLNVVSGTTGSGTTNLIVSVAANNSEVNERTGSLTVAGQTILVTQAGVLLGQPTDCADLQLQRTGDQVPARGLINPLMFGVTVDWNCDWDARSSVPWITVVVGETGASNIRTGGGLAGSGTGVVSYLAEPNSTAAARSGSILVGTNVFTINQTGGAEASIGRDSGGDGAVCAFAPC